MRVRDLRWLTGGSLVLGSLLYAAQSPSTIPMPGPQAWVVDLVGVLPADQVAALNALGDRVHERERAALAVVVIDSTDGADPRRLAADLFNRWGLGRSDRDNGLLLFVALNDRAAEIVLGDGIDSDAEVAASERIMQDTIVPRFRAGRPADAISAGARACAERFFGATSQNGSQMSSAPPPPLEVERQTTPDPARESGNPGSSVVGLGVLGAIGATIAGAVVWLVRRVFARRRPRRCRHCATLMQRLDEAADDAHLGASERVEEKIGSVDYDVWFCPSCNAVEKLRYGRWFTGYSKCPLCGSVTKNSTQRTLRSASTVSTGLAEVHEKCVSCTYAKTYTRVIPRVSSSSSSGASSRSGGGGGTSSGRGASGRW